MAADEIREPAGFSSRARASLRLPGEVYTVRLTDYVAEFSVSS